ncbi:MAG: zinc ribbon domain-containing protein [Candidatus Methanomethylophilaceae archaeon]|nr:zinc ribbon domain-containing protein [Candidatus Methanomethylophilaceae archaeon]
MLDRRECYCQLLGLNPLRGSKYSDEAVMAAIDSAEEEWRKSSRTTDSTVRFKASKYLEEVPEMRATMKDPERRRLEFEAARKLLEGRLQGLKRQGVVLSDGSVHVFPDVITRQLAVLRWKGITESDVKAITGVKNTAPPSPVGSKVQNAYKAMAKVGAYTPAELFNALIDRPDLKIDRHPLNDASGFALAESTLKACEERVNNIKLADFPEQDAYIMCIRTVKLAFANESDYSELVRFGKCNRDLAPVMDLLETEYSARLTRKDIDRILEVQHSKIDLDMAIPILQIFCYSRKIPANFSESDSNMIRCPECWTLIEASDETAFCSTCGYNIRVACPSCGSKQLSKNRMCSTCGFDFKDGMNNARRLERSFKMNIAKGRIDSAASDLEEIKASYSGLLEASVLEPKLSEARKKFSTYIGIIDDAYARRRFYDAKGSCESLNAVYPDIFADNPDLRHKYEDSLRRYEEAERICRSADGLDSEDKKLACYINAADVCPDHPEARSKLREHPPQCPTDSEAFPKNDVVSIKFSPPADTKGVTYCIYRQEGSIPRIDENTVPLVETSKCSFEDTTPEPGVNYYYVLCSKRWGILSRNKELIGPVMVLTEVGNVKIDATEEGFRLSYEKPKKASRVRIWRRKKDDESEYTELDIKGADVYDDVCLGGTSYYYLFVAEYDINNRPLRSEGVEYSASSMKMPEPVNNLDIRRDRTDGTYVARWSSNYDATLYYSTKRLRFGNRIMKTEDVKSWMTEIEPVDVYSDGIRFAMEDGAVWYIYPIIQRGKTCVRGNEARVSNLIPFRDVEKSVVNRECVITMNWPKFAVEAEFRISNNEPKDPEDPDLEIKTVKREEYEENRHVRIPMGNSPRKFVYIYAMYKVEDEMVPSRPIMISVYSVECRKVRYAASKSKKSLTFEFSADRDVPEIPPVMAVQSS